MERNSATEKVILVSTFLLAVLAGNAFCHNLLKSESTAILLLCYLVFYVLFTLLRNLLMGMLTNTAAKKQPAKNKKRK